MFKKHKLEVRLVKDVDAADKPVAPEEPKLNAYDYASIAEDAAVRIGKKLILGAVVTVAAVAVITVLTNAADSALQNAIND